MGDEIYRVNYDKIVNLAEGFKEPLENDYRKNSQLGTEKEPYVVMGVTPQQFQLFLTFIEHKYVSPSLVYCLVVLISPCESHWEPPLVFSESELLDLYRVTAIYLCPKALDWVVERLELLELHPSRKLGLAIELGIKQWVRPTVKALMTIPMYTLDDSQRRSMGTDVALLITVAQMMIMTSRVTMGRTPPPIFYDFGDMACNFHGDIHKTSRCAEAWDTTWWNQIGRALTNLSEPPLSTARVIDLIEGTDFEGAGVTKECVQEGLKEIRWKLQKEVDIWERVVNRIFDMLAMGYYNSR